MKDQIGPKGSTNLLAASNSWYHKAVFSEPASGFNNLGSRYSWIHVMML